MKRKVRASKAGFTLIEILIIIAVIGILGLATLLVIKRHNNSVDSSKTSPATSQTTKGADNTNLKDANPANTLPVGGSKQGQSSAGTQGSSSGNQTGGLPTGSSNSSNTTSGSGAPQGSTNPEPELPGSNCVHRAGYMCPGLTDGGPAN